MALHTSSLGAMGPMGGPLETGSGTSGNTGGGIDPSQASPMAAAPPSAPNQPNFMRYQGTPYASVSNDPFANGGPGGNNNSGLVSYTEESAGQPPPTPTPNIHMQPFASQQQPQSQRLVQQPTIIGPG